MLDETPEDTRPLDQAILDHVMAHVDSEGEILAQYAAAGRGATADVRYLMDLIMEDERRHHRIFMEMAEQVRRAGDPPTDPSSPVPDEKAFSAELFERTKRFIELEKEDARQLKELRRRLRPTANDSIWPLLVDYMALDTEKHLRMLRYIEDRCRP